MSDTIGVAASVYASINQPMIELVSSAGSLGNTSWYTALDRWCPRLSSMDRRHLRQQVRMLLRELRGARRDHEIRVSTLTTTEVDAQCAELGRRLSLLIARAVLA